MSIESMAAMLEEKKRQREREEELNITGPQNGSQSNDPTNDPMSMSNLQRAAAELDALLATMPQTPVTQLVQQTSNQILNQALPWWNDNHPSKQNMKRIQTSLREERIKQGLTQRQLAVKCDMSQGSITRAEKNGWISITTLLRIANALGKEIILN